MYWIIPTVAFFASILTFFSGFGLGTLLLASMLLFFPIHEAVLMTAIVHLTNSFWKLLLNHKNIKVKVILSFGIMSILFGIIGAWILNYVVVSKYCLYRLTYFNEIHEVGIVQFLMACLIIVFAIFELKNHSRFKQVPLWFGGMISGFFGGLSGHQGALRTAFLVQRISSKESLISTTALIALLTDIFRVGVYSYHTSWQKIDGVLIGTSMFCAFFGVWIGSQLLKKTSFTLLKNIIAFSLILLGIAIGVGII